MRAAILVALAVLIGVAALGSPASTSASYGAPDPGVSEPVTGGVHGRPFMPSYVKPEAYGYTETEYFLSGTARSYGANRQPARFTTRILVHRPRDPSRFSGTTFMEWNNVTFQADVPVEFTWSYPQVFRSGDAYVQVTAQQAGVCGPGLSGSFPAACTPVSLKRADPDRYRPLHHPGDDFSYDIFTQAARAVLQSRKGAPLGDLQVRTLVAVGESQSAGALDLYIRYGADNEARVFDAFLIDGDAHSRLPSSYRVPTIHVWSEESAQPVESTAGHNHRIWMVAGAPHIDRWVVDHALPQVLRSATTGGTSSLKRDNAALRQRSGAYGERGRNRSSVCGGGAEFPRRYVIDAAMAALKDWVKHGTPAPSAPSLEFTSIGVALGRAPRSPRVPGLPAEGLNAAGLIGSPFALVRDQHGNAKGGLRLPVLDVPVAQYDGTGCLLLGTSTTFTPTELARRYPSHSSYVEQLRRATRRAVRQRLLTRTDAQDLMQRARRAPVLRKR